MKTVVQIVLAAVALCGTMRSSLAEFPVSDAALTILKTGTYKTWVDSKSRTCTYLLWTSGKSLPTTLPRWEYKKDGNGSVLPASGVEVADSPGTGECVALRRLTSPLAPALGTDNKGWRAGKRVVNGGVKVGVLIASFRPDSSGKLVYNNHTAIFRGYSSGNLLIWSQRWPETFRGICAQTITGSTGGGVLDKNTYYVVEKP